jgi:TFIIF-interacting CTD phosphatase-like protein
MLLVILDLNGTLAETSFNKINSADGIQPDIKARTKYVYFRPHMKEFIEWLFSQEDIQVGVWTSCIKENAMPLVQGIFGKHVDELKFIYTREDCKNNRTKEDKYGTIKDLNKIWSTMGQAHGWDRDNTIIVEDSPHKLIMQPQNLLLIGEYKVPRKTTEQQDSELLRIKNVLQIRLSSQRGRDGGNDVEV